MCKLIIQIPCYNEEQTLPATLADLPREIEGVDVVEWLIIDDGSTDGTVSAAREFGVDHVIRHRRNRGLAISFQTGIDACLQLGADIIVNTDGDNQYAGCDIAKLVSPILSGEADMVVGDRQTSTIEHFSRKKKALQKIGSFIVRKLSKTDVPDCVSGFRAFSREAAIKINIVSSFSYTIETIIQAGRKKVAIQSVPISTNEQTRKSRLFKNMFHFLGRSGATIVRIYSMYNPLKVFCIISLIMILLGIAPILRFLFYYFSGNGSGHLQSLGLGSALVIMGFTTLITGLLADLISFNRQLIELTLEKVRKIELVQNSTGSKENVFLGEDLTNHPK